MMRGIIQFRKRQLEGLARAQATTGASRTELVRQGVDS